MDKLLHFFRRNKNEPSEAGGYLNSVLQVLYMTKDFRERVTSHTKSNPKTEYIDRELNDLFLELEGKVGCTVNITNKLKIHNVHMQHDAADLYEKILRLTSPEASEIFHGKLTNRNTCLKCHSQIETEAGFWHLPLPLSNDDDCSVERSILNFFRSSVISGDDQMYCETCREKCDAVLECEMTHPPEVLGLLIKQFVFDHTLGKYLKIRSFVDVPLVLNIQNQIYELYAFVEHFGDQRSGHKSLFVATIKGHDGIWHTFDDAYVIQRSRNLQSCPTERSQTAYLLFYQRRKAGKYNGLLNLGATCYLNSVLQVLFMTEDFRESVKNHFRSNPGTEHIDRELRDLFCELEECWAYTYTYNIMKKLKISNVFEQRDAAEHYEKIMHLTSPEASQIFHGELINRNICKQCQNATESKAGFWTLPLPLVNDNNEYSVEKGIDDFFRSSEISGDDQMYCEICDEKCDAVLDCKMEHYPDVLVLLLKRFELIFDGKVWKKVKINCLVKIPDTLQMETYKYKLYAYVEHFGDLRSGHYTAIIKSQDDGLWYIFDDSKVKVSNYNHFQLDPTETSRSVYLLFYQRQKATTLTNMDRHHSSEEKEKKVSPASKRNMNGGRPRGENVNIDSNDDQNEAKRRKTNRKDVLGQGECHKRSQVPEDTRGEKDQNLYPVKQSKPNVKRQYGDSSDVNVEPKMLVYRQHNGGQWEDQKMAMRQEFKHPQSVEYSQQDAQYRDRPPKQVKHNNIWAPSQNEMQWEDQPMVKTQQLVAEYRQQDDQRHEDRDRLHRQDNGSIGCTPRQNEMQWELNKRQPSKQIDYSSYEQNQSKARRDKQHVSQQDIGLSEYRQDRHEHYRRIKSSNSAPSQNRMNMNRNHHVYPYPSIPNRKRGGSSARCNDDSFQGHRQYCSQDVQLEKFSKEIQGHKMKNNELRKKNPNRWTDLLPQRLCEETVTRRNILQRPSNAEASAN
ncbi:uncharacterized protein LOC117385995 isoform X1 [Periophthalmus magnuspinnatus]|uniref:uncharacterized protein LOC117385995 isoform X1 n=1 Tax=Periophthalmus magnuspinnatus TaxID=409849 RepID=UPI0024369EEB|nr:uncharacterized protein LOC117385995 isoform X1 [Periophthalmus magnuspinnatus]